MLVNRDKPDGDGVGAATVTVAVCVAPLLSMTRNSALTPSVTPATVTVLPLTEAEAIPGFAATAVKGAVPPEIVMVRVAPGDSANSRGARVNVPSAGLLVTLTERETFAFRASVTVIDTGVVSPRTAAMLSVESLTEASATAGF
jgi:hypothetical protein